MCICCLLVGGSTRFPFVLLSVRDEMLNRPTSDVQVHPVSTTTCCLDESLPPEKRGSWLALNPRNGSFSVLTNSTQPGRPEPEKGAVPSRGLLVLAACETASGRVSEPVTAHPVSWTTPANNNDDATTNDGEKKQLELPRNIFSDEELVNRLSGFNLLSGCILPGKLDIRYTTNVYNRCFDQLLHSASRNGKDGGGAGDGWSLSNTFLDNVKEPRLAYLKKQAAIALKKFEQENNNNSSSSDTEGGDSGTVKKLADALGDVLLLRPNFSNADLPLENLNLSEAEKKNPIDVELERVCQRNIASFGQWYDGPMPDPEPAVKKEESDAKKKGERGGSDDTDEEGFSAFDRQNSKVDLDKFKVSPAVTPQSKPNVIEWGTRMHTLVIVEKNNDNNSATIHYFDRKIDIQVDHASPKVGIAMQPPHEFIPRQWTHMKWTHENKN